MTELPTKPTRKITDDPYGAAILIRRLVMEQGFVYWRRYVTAFALMGISAGATAGSAYILGQVINQAYIDKNVMGIAILSGVTVVLLFIKGLATYGHTVILSKISNAILANNQRRLFAKLMSESIGFYSERHSSEFLARLTSGAKSITDVLTLLINAVGRDVLLLVSLIFVMVTQDPVLSFIGLVVVPPAMLILRKLIKRIKGLAHNQFTGSADIMETMQESLQGIRTVKAFTLEAAMQRAQRQQDGAGLQSLQPVDGNARRLCGCRLPALWRLQRGRARRYPRTVFLLHDRVPAGDRAGQAAGAAQHRPQQPAGRRAHAARNCRQPGERAQ
jgi:ATP-binding cassette subfamily B protein